MANKTLKGRLQTLFREYDSKLVEESRTQMKTLLKMDNASLYDFRNKLLATLHEKYLRAVKLAQNHFTTFPQDDFESYCDEDLSSELDLWDSVTEKLGYALLEEIYDEQAEILSTRSVIESKEEYNFLMENDPAFAYGRAQEGLEEKLTDERYKQIEDFVISELASSFNQILGELDTSGHVVALFLALSPRDKELYQNSSEA